jgi:Beta-propeller repeat
MSRRHSVPALFVLALAIPAAAAPRTAQPAARAAVAHEYGKLPLGWEANRGQADPQIKFLGHGPGYALFLTQEGAVLTLGRSQAGTPLEERRPLSRAQEQKEKVLTLAMRLLGSNPAAPVEPLDRLPSRANYFLGNDPSRWLTGVPMFSRVRYRGVYPGVDLVFHGSAARQLEYDLVLSPGTDPGSIRIRFDGAAVAIRDGRLLLRTPLGVLSEPAPVAFQKSGAQERLVAARYVRRGSQDIGFQLGPHDANLPVTIDPVLAYSTYLGGSSTDAGGGIAVDTSGNAYVTGTTFSSDFAGCTGLVNPPCNDAANTGGDVFVAKLNAAGSALGYVTYLGGSSLERGFGIAVDSSGNAYVTGFTFSSNFPQVNGLTNTVGLLNAFVTKLNPSGNIAYSTYLDGSSDSAGGGIAADSSGNAYVTGFTDSSDFPVAGQLSSGCVSGGFTSAFVTKLNTNASGASSLVYSTCLGGVGGVVNGSAIAADASQNAYVTGTSSDFDLLTTYGFTGGCALYGNSDAFVARLDTTKTGSAALLFLTCLGSGNFPQGNASSTNMGNAIAVDGSSNAYVAGQTFSSDFPTTTSAAQTTCDINGDAFIAKLNTNVSGSSSLVYSTCLGGNAGTEAGNGIAADNLGNAYVAGETDSLDCAIDNFPTTPSAIQGTYGGGCSDAFFAQINTTSSGASSLIFASYLGGSALDFASAVAFDGGSNVYLTGGTTSAGPPSGITGFPVQNALFPNLAGGEDAFVTKITFSILFSQFSTKLAIVSSPPGFNFNSSFTLGPGGSINPMTDPMTLQVGPPATGYSVTIPPGSFQFVGGNKHYVFSGTIGGATISVNLSPVSATSYTFRGSVAGPNLTGLTNPVSVTLTIGNNTGTTQVTASFQ